MINIFPVELIFEILSYLNKCKDLRSCLFVCYQWSQLIPNFVQINYHHHKLFRWFNIHQQIKKYQPQNSLQRRCEISTFTFLYDCGYSIELFCGINHLLIACTTVFHHSCELFNIPFSTTPCVQTIHIYDKDTFCVHLQNLGKIRIKLSENESPSYSYELKWSPLCLFFDSCLMQPTSKKISCYMIFEEFVIFVDALWPNVINLKVFDNKREDTVTISKLSSVDDGIDVKISKNYLFFPAEKTVACWCKNEFCFNYFKIDNQPERFTNADFLSTKNHHLLFWFDHKCYVGNVKNRLIYLTRFDQFDQSDIKNIIQCEKNDETFAISNPFAIRFIET